jgi:hypothetical protein
MRPRLPGSLAVAGRQLRRVLRTRALRPRRLPRTASPPLAASGPRRNVPGVARRELVRAVRHRVGAPVAGRKVSSPGRNAAHCPCRPLHPQGHPTILSNRSAERIVGTHPCARSHCRPGGPDGEGQAKGQARNARRRCPNCGTTATAAGIQRRTLADEKASSGIGVGMVADVFGFPDWRLNAHAVARPPRNG